MNNNFSCFDIIKKIKNTIENHDLIAKDDSILVALSGGADSVFLLDVLCSLKEELNIKVAAAHLNHMIRGAEADRDEAYAAELCTKLNVPFYAERVDIPMISANEGISEELAGRNARYDFFKRLCDKYGYNKIATAHNKNDKAETVLMRIIRGTGIDGLCAIKYKRDDNVIRPILDIERESIEWYCGEKNLSYCTDSTNSDTEYTRNRIRNELIPLIEKNYNPSVIESLCSLSDNASEDSDFINGYAERLCARINSPMPKKKDNILDIESLKLLEESILNRIIRLTAQNVMGAEYKLERIHIENIKNLLDKQTGASTTLPSGLIVAVKYGWLEFLTEKDTDESVSEFCYSIDGVEENNTEIHGISFSICSPCIKPERNQMVIDYDMIEGKELSVRNRRAGDRMVFFKDGKTRKLKDYWIDKKIPRDKRKEIPLLCADNEIVAIIGDRVSEKYKIKENTKQGLVITYESDNENW